MEISVLAFYTLHDRHTCLKLACNIVELLTIEFKIFSMFDMGILLILLVRGRGGFKVGASQRSDTPSVY
jgi:hypothetical protein